MRPIFTLFLVLSSLQLFKSQVLYEENFESYSLGSIVGQNNYQINNYDFSNLYTITSVGSGKVLQINSGPFESRELFKFLSSTPDSMNKILEVEFDFYTGSTVNNSSYGGLYFVLQQPELNYERIGLSMFQNSKKIVCTDYTWDTWINFYELGENNTSIYLTSNSWVRMGFSYDSTTNKITLKGPGFYKTLSIINNPTQIQNIAGLEFWVEHTSNTDELASYFFDNILVKAVAKESLGIEENSKSAEISIFPNPTSDFINIKTTKKIINAYIYDWAGIRQEVKMEGGQIHVKTLPAGSYVLGLKTDSGFISKKFIKN